MEKILCYARFQVIILVTLILTDTRKPMNIPENVKFV